MVNYKEHYVSFYELEKYFTNIVGEDKLNILIADIFNNTEKLHITDEELEHTILDEDDLK